MRQERCPTRCPPFKLGCCQRIASITKPLFRSLTEQHGAVFGPLHFLPMAWDLRLTEAPTHNFTRLISFWNGSNITSPFIKYTIYIGNLPLYSFFVCIFAIHQVRLKNARAKMRPEDEQFANSEITYRFVTKSIVFMQVKSNFPNFWVRSYALCVWPC